MGNKQAASEWLSVAQHDLSAAEKLYNDNHFTDTISALLQQSLEKILKALWAYNNQKVKKTHDLVEIYSFFKEVIPLKDEEIDLLDIASGYYVENRYPGFFHSLPDREEIEVVIKFARSLFKRVCEFVGFKNPQ